MESLAAGFGYNGNAGSSGVDPAAKLPVPLFQLQHRCSVWALGVDQNLLIKRALIAIARRTQKARPVLITAGQLRQRGAI